MKQPEDRRAKRGAPSADLLRLPDQIDMDLEATMLYDRLPAAYFQRPDRRVTPPDDW